MDWELTRINGEIPDRQKQIHYFLYLKTTDKQLTLFHWVTDAASVQSGRSYYILV